MINNNKILTVSYGTFSCTLEGFEDSFGTMKAIAEYFRDLAADDRYFGAEPPQPDAELLAKIAEREVSRRVEAREHEGRIMLKAHEDLSTGIPALASEDEAPKTSNADEEKSAAKKKKKAKAKKRKAKKAKAKLAAAGLALDGATVVAAEENREAEAPVADESETVAELTMDEVVEGAASAGMAPLTEETVADDASADPVAEETLDAEQPAEVFAADMGIEEDEAASFFAQSSVDNADMMATEEPISAGVFTDPTSSEDTVEDAEDIVAEEVEHVALAVEAESFADKLARIRAVVSDQETQEAAPQYDEDSEILAADQQFEDADAAFAETEASEPQNEVVAEAAQDIVSAFAQDDEVLQQVDAVEDEADDVEDEADDLDDILKRIEETADDEDFDLAAEDDGAEDEADDTTENLFEAPEATDTEEEIEEVQGRVLKVNRSDLEAALASGDLEEQASEEPEADVNTASEEADGLKDDLEAMENAPDQEETTLGSSRHSLPAIDEETSEDISRLMAEADHQMEEPEGKTRRSAFAHLRAAVAARFADRSMDGDDADEAAEAEAYRSDLAEVVKPRRPEAPTQKSERPNDDRAAPLKLVAEQRINAEEEANRGPVSPRRVAASMEDDLILTDDTGFAAYAEERGAESLPQLLEAAAAYLSYVEGHEQFSRPQLMSRVRQADCGEFTREDGLRSFGQLLRTGKIEKIKGGRFTASDGIGYKPDHRAAG